MDINAFDNLVEAGLRPEVSIFDLRSLAYNRSNTIVDHTLMETLTITTSEFLEMVDQVKSRYGRVANSSMLTSGDLAERADRTRVAPRLSPADAQ